MKTGTIAILGVLAALALFAASYIGTVFTFRTDCIGAEAGIKAQYKQDQNNYDNMRKKFIEMAQVPKMKASQLEKLYDGTMQGRYGDKGSQALLQFITEQNPNLGEGMYEKLMTAIEAGRNGFEADQKQLLARKQEYEKLLGSTRALFVNMWLGFPRINLAEFDIVTSAETEEAFKTKKADPIQLQ